MSKKTSNNTEKAYIKTKTEKNALMMSVTLEESSIINKNNIFTVLTSLQKSLGNQKVKPKNNLHELNHLRQSIQAFETCLQILKVEIFENFKPILNQIRNFNEESLKTAYKIQFKKMLTFIFSCYENLTFLQILNQNFFKAINYSKEGLCFISNIEKGILGFSKIKSERLKINLKESFITNFKNTILTEPK